MFSNPEFSIPRENPSCFGKPLLRSGTPAPPLTVAGWHTTPKSRKIPRIMCVRFPTKAAAGKSSTPGGTAPIFCRNGRQLFFYNLADDRIMVARYSARGGSFVAEKPRLWSDLSLAALSAPTGAQYDLATDGKRLVAATYAGGATQQNWGHIIFLENFIDEIQSKAQFRDKWSSNVEGDSYWRKSSRRRAGFLELVLRIAPRLSATLP
jgi:hypothetical protein